MWQVPYIIDMQKQGCAADGEPVEVPFNALGKKIFDERTETHSKDDPEGFCLPPGIPRMMYTPYPTEIFQMPDRILFIYEGGAHVWRIIWMDGRKQPADPNPNYLGYSVGHWEGDTLVVDTIGMNDRTWLDAAGHPHGEKLHVTEKFTQARFEYAAPGSHHRRSGLLHQAVDRGHDGDLGSGPGTDGIHLPGEQQGSAAPGGQVARGRDRSKAR